MSDRFCRGARAACAGARRSWPSSTIERVAVATASGYGLVAPPLASGATTIAFAVLLLVLAGWRLTVTPDRERSARAVAVTAAASFAGILVAGAVRDLSGSRRLLRRRGTPGQPSRRRRGATRHTDRGIRRTPRGADPQPGHRGRSAGRWPPSIETATYFVCAEALTNIAKYARAREATITVTVADGELRASIADDGIGGADPTRGSGLRGLTDRVEALGGRLTVDSPPGQGTRLIAEIPIH
jgi:hypothetical protein